MRMIPPISSTQNSAVDIQNMVGWKNPFNMRQVTLMNLTASHLSVKNGSRSNLPYHRKTYSITSPNKSLDILRKNLQNAINKDIEAVIKKYVEKFFQPAIANIKNNFGGDSVNDDHIKEVCRKILEEAKCLYKSSSSRDSSPYECSDSEASILDGRIGYQSPCGVKRKESDTDSENYKYYKRSKLRSAIDLTHKPPIKREGPKWNSDRINNNTLFIMGAKANKVLGFGQTRGRLYVRHPEILRYSGDQEDKEWLTSRNLMPPSGGKAYLMILSDIKELTESEDYRNSPNLQLSELKGFEVPPFLINKIKCFMESARTDKGKFGSMDLFDFRTHCVSSPSLTLDSPSTPSDLMPVREAESSSSKHSDLVNIPETSPSSNHSMMSGTMNQSPLTTPAGLMSPNILLSVQNIGGCSETPMMMLKGTTQNGNAITSILARHFGTESTEGF